MKTIWFFLFLLGAFWVVYFFWNDKDVYITDGVDVVHTNPEENNAWYVDAKQQDIYDVNSFVEEMSVENIPLLIATWSFSALYLGNQEWWMLQISSSSWTDMYTYVLKESNYNIIVALWWNKYNQHDFYELMKQKWIAASSWCMLDQDGFEIADEDYQKKLDDYWKRYEEAQKTGKDFFDDWSVDVFRCGNKKVFCEDQWCGWVFNVKSGWWGHWFLIQEESLVVY